MASCILFFLVILLIVYNFVLIIFVLFDESADKSCVGAPTIAIFQRYAVAYTPKGQGLILKRLELPQFKKCSVSQSCKESMRVDFSFVC